MSKWITFWICLLYNETSQFYILTVSPSYCEPYPGWVDSFYGPMGVLIGASLGILRSVQGNGDVKTDILPVDFGINALIAVAWDTAMNK